MNRFNWIDIQSYYDDKHTWKEVRDKFTVSFNVMSDASKCGLFRTRTISETSKIRPKHYKHTPQAKLNMSIGRKKYLKDNPDKCSWQTKSHHTSIPCEKLKDVLKLNNITFISEYQPLLHKERFFSIDIAFPDKKVGIEVNGRQHYNSDGTLTKYCQDRHDLIEADGWKLYEIPYNAAFNTVEMLKLVNQIITTNSKLEFSYELYQKKKVKVCCDCPAEILNGSTRCVSCDRKHRPRKAKLPSKATLHNMIWEFPIINISKLYAVSDTAIRKWCKSYGLVIPSNRYRTRIYSKTLIDYQI
jgi:very-short-patch-repair endonuclease